MTFTQEIAPEKKLATIIDNERPQFQVVEAHAEIPNDKQQELSRQVSDIELQAVTLVINNQQDYELAGEFGRFCKQKAADVKSFWKPMKEAAHKAHAEICSKEKAMLEPLSKAESIVKDVMGNYALEQKRKQREAEEAARRAAKEAADKMLQEAAELETKGELKKATQIVDEAEMVSNSADMMSFTTEKPKAEGVSTSVDWKITEVDASRVPVDINGVEIRPVDTKAIMRLIRASKGKIVIPGVTYEETVKMSFRK